MIKCFEITHFPRYNETSAQSKRPKKPSTGSQEGHSQRIK